MQTKTETQDEINQAAIRSILGAMNPSGRS